MEEIKQALEQYRMKVGKKTCNKKELAQALGISEYKANILMHIEGFPVIKIGRDSRVILSKLDDWLEEHIGEVL